MQFFLLVLMSFLRWNPLLYMTAVISLPFHLFFFLLFTQYIFMYTFILMYWQYTFLLTYLWAVWWLFENLKITNQATFKHFFQITLYSYFISCPHHSPPPCRWAPAAPFTLTHTHRHAHILCRSPPGLPCVSALPEPSDSAVTSCDL